jgi:hypothetical protein
VFGGRVGASLVFLHVLEVDSSFAESLQLLGCLIPMEGKIEPASLAVAINVLGDFSDFFF